MFGLFILLAVAGIALVTIVTIALIIGAQQPPRQTAAWAVHAGRPCDPGELDVVYDDWTLERPDGATLPVWTIDGAAGAHAPTVVIAHGWGQSRLGMLALVERFAPHAARLALYDLRGHGDAEGGRSRLGVDEHHDLVALLDRLDARAQVILCGLSMGAVIALHAAAHDARIHGVIAHAPYDDFRDALHGRLRLRDLPTRPFTDLARWYWRRRGLAHVPTTSIAPHVACPVLIVHGTDDPISPFDDARRIAAALPRATLLEVDGGRHLGALHHAGPAYDTAVAEFFAQVATAPTTPPEPRRA